MNKMRRKYPNEETKENGQPAVKYKEEKKNTKYCKYKVGKKDH